MKAHNVTGAAASAMAALELHNRNDLAPKLAEALRALLDQKRAPGIDEWMNASAVLREYDESV